MRYRVFVGCLAVLSWWGAGSVFADSTNLIDPTKWRSDAWAKGDDKVRFQKEAGPDPTLMIDCVVPNDARFNLALPLLDPGTYRFSAMVRTENVGPAKGASLGVDGHIETSAEVHGTAGPSPIELFLIIDSTTSALTVDLQVGGYSSPNSGRAWFSQVRFESVAAAPAGVAAIDLRQKDKAAGPKTAEPGNIFLDRPLAGPKLAFWIGLAIVAGIGGWLWWRGRRPPLTVAAPHQPSGGHYGALDGLRAIAIALVVWYHLWQASFQSFNLHLGSLTIDLDQFPAVGFMGVELFLFISAFCLFLPYARSVFEARPLPSLRTYTYKRFIKIVPSYVLAVLLMLIIRSEFTNGPDLVWNLLRHLTFTHNLSPETFGTISGVFWSLGVEVQFYLIFPLLAWAFRRQPLVTYAGMVVAAYGFRILGMAVTPGAYHFWLNQMPGFLDLFANGMLAAWLVVRLGRNSANGLTKSLSSVAAAGGLVLFGLVVDWIASVRFLDKGIMAWQGWYRGAFGLVVLIVAIASSFAWPVVRGILSNRVALFISTISYNWYLWHQFIAIEFVKRQVPLPTTIDPHDDPNWKWPYLALAGLTGLVVATIITYGFERPLLKYGFGGVWQRLRQRFKKPTSE